MASFRSTLSHVTLRANENRPHSLLCRIRKYAVKTRILRKPLLLQPENAVKVVLTCLHLHNFLRKSQSYSQPGAFNSDDTATETFVLVNKVQGKIEEVEDKVQGKIEEVEDKVQGKIEEVKEKVQVKIGDLEKRLSELEDRPINFPSNPDLTYSRPTVKSLTFDGQTSWTVFKTQFDVVSSANGWNNRVKASQLVASLRGTAAEVLQGIPSDKLTDLMTIENALEARFGDSHLTQFYRTELKTRRQKPGESLQVLAADVERLMSLAYAECPQDVRDSLAAQYFVDAIRDEDTQHATRLMDAKDLKSALAYSMKYEAAKTVSKTSRNVRSIKVEDGTGKEKDEKFDCLLKTLEKLLNSHVAGKRNTPRRNPNVTCWRCNKKGHVQRECQTISPNQEN
ncbi:hypothetical protein AVEN_246829-1 [Araneus ventricosus]|uniref:CCHC-type domain-containing protein n=1 Tax=Araneus ventricosus TaxID=182803 RepID=A0A4Y2VAZ4_ARAVE|nr:hypothetical protein AVEN_246829-1 [Araneus ventricosus]